jgi:hypothetical protein
VYYFDATLQISEGYRFFLFPLFAQLQAGLQSQLDALYSDDGAIVLGFEFL